MTFKKMIIGVCNDCGKEGVEVKVIGVPGNTKCICKRCNSNISGE